MQKKIVRRDTPTGLAELANFHPLLQRVYAARDVASPDEMGRELSDLLPFSSLKGIDQAVARIISAIRQNERILIVGDFDADGATSTAVAVKALREMGAKHVDFIVPNRFEYGYGLTPEIVNVAVDRQPNLIITVDNGISSIAGVERAHALSIDVVVTDHHLAGDSLPNACAIVNPNQPGDTFESKHMAGVGVIFYVMLALRSELKSQGWFEQQSIAMPRMSDYLDLVALGTVADVVKLDRNNRVLVFQGMRRIRGGHLCPGIRALFDVAKKPCHTVVSSDLGYIIGPRLNAAGRIDDMTLGINCLLSDNYEEAYQIGLQLDQLNFERRAIEDGMRQEAFACVDAMEMDDDLPMGVCLYNENWHQGIVGLVASRVKEKVHLPTIAFAKEDDENIKGSARSIKGLHIRDVLDEMATAYPGLITKFGGHAMAAGLSIRLSEYERFRQAFAETVVSVLGKDKLERVVETDGELEIDEISMETAELLRESGPWGQGFPEPTFDGVFTIADQRLVGRKHLKLTLKMPHCQYFFDAIAFNIDTTLWPNPHCKQVFLAYRLDINQYRGRRNLQLIVEHLEPVQSHVNAYA